MPGLPGKGAAASTDEMLELEGEEKSRGTAPERQGRKRRVRQIERQPESQCDETKGKSVRGQKRRRGGRQGREGVLTKQAGLRRRWKMVQGLSWSGATTYGAAAAVARLGWN